MDAQTLGALANIVKEAIAEAVAPLQDRIKELEGRPVHSAYDDSTLMREVKTLRLSCENTSGRLDVLELVEPYDDSGLVARVAKQLEDFRSELPKAYDDAWARECFDAVQTTLDTLKSVKPYDDSTLRQHFDAVIKAQDEQINLAMKMATERPDPTPARDGAPGADGRDALQIELLPAIDPTKSYPRGTYAKHNGGTWRAYEQTHGMRGWECTQDGVAAIVPKLEGKSLVLTIVQSSGTESMLVADLPIQSYRGVWSEQDYIAHDTATWAGSLWHCNVTGTKAKPGDGSPDWTLAVKKGRDGREVVSVPKGAHQPVQIGGANG